MSRIGLHLVREALSEIADEAYQCEIWLASDGPRVGSLLEATERLFDDSGLGDALARAGSPAFDEPIDDGLRRLRQVLMRLSDSNLTVADVLADRRMVEARALAAKALFALVRLEAERSRTTGE
jgi:hypothetical protein